MYLENRKQHYDTASIFTIHGGVGPMMYLPEGGVTSDVEEFISFYSEKYFSAYPKNNENRENEIIRITRKAGDIEPDDVIKLMRWKAGDSKNEEAVVDCYGKRITLDIGGKVVKAISAGAGQDAMGIYQALLSQNMYGLGTVYLLTLVWAISGMTYPIYDKYAHIAISSICAGVKPNAYVYKSPPDKTKIDEIRYMYGNYQNQLSKVFGEDWKTRREIDQALWVYGHQKF